MINKNLIIQKLNNFSVKKVTIDVLRLDKVHSIVSGNKWFKLQLYLKDALENNKTCIATFGGAFSNHIVATAFACKQLSLKCFGIIRGDEFVNTKLSHTLEKSVEYGMNLFFLNRNDYANKTIPTDLINENFYLINEGGYGNLGALGFSKVFDEINNDSYSHIICACGTGTTLAGCVIKAKQNQNIIGINVLKGYEKIDEEIRNILPKEFKNKNFSVYNEYHFNGYAKKNAELIQFMNDLYEQYNLPTDFVYTAKLFYGLNDLLVKDILKKSDKILVIHSGGLQGNLSLPINSLRF